MSPVALAEVSAAMRQLTLCCSDERVRCRLPVTHGPLSPLFSQKLIDLATDASAAFVALLLCLGNALWHVVREKRLMRCTKLSEAASPLTFRTGERVR